MNIEQIIQLTQAGFTADQITALAPLLAQPAAPALEQAAPIVIPSAPAPEPVTPAAPAAPTAPAAPAAPADPHGFAAAIDSINEQIKALTTALQANAVRTSSAPVEQLTAQDVAASIINPPKRAKTGGNK